MPLRPRSQRVFPPRRTRRSGPEPPIAPGGPATRLPPARMLVGPARRSRRPYGGSPWSSTSAARRASRGWNRTFRPRRMAALASGDAARFPCRSRSSMSSRARSFPRVESSSDADAWRAVSDHATATSCSAVGLPAASSIRPVQSSPPGGAGLVVLHRFGPRHSLRGPLRFAQGLLGGVPPPGHREHRPPVLHESGQRVARALKLIEAYAPPRGGSPCPRPRQACEPSASRRHGPRCCLSTGGAPSRPAPDPGAASLWALEGGLNRVGVHDRLANQSLWDNARARQSSRLSPGSLARSWSSWSGRRRGSEKGLTT